MRRRYRLCRDRAARIRLAHCSSDAPQVLKGVSESILHHHSPGEEFSQLLVAESQVGRCSLVAGQLVRDELRCRGENAEMIRAGYRQKMNHRICRSARHILQRVKVTRLRGALEHEGRALD